MDQVTAHLERGWDLIQKGDYRLAESAARKILKIDKHAPEAYTLLGVAAAVGGDYEAALENYDKAMSLDPDFVDPILYAAELQLGPLENGKEAVRLCELALAAAEEEDEFIDALLLKGEAQLLMGNPVAARATLSDLPPSELPEAAYNLRAGHLWLELHELDKAQEEMEKALKRDPQMTDALHGLALIAEERGDFKEMCRLYLQVRKADLAQPAPPWGISRERFEQLAEAALGELPARVRRLLKDVPILVADYPSVEVVAEGNDPRMLGLFSGVPYPEQAAIGGATPHLDGVFLYQRNIEQMCHNSDEVEDEIRKTLFHETGHFFGLNEEQLEEMGLG
jgi:predicted Zn-dependent protease with MMP-like domain